MSDRERNVGDVVAGAVSLSRAVAAQQRTPFEGIDPTPNQLALLFLLAHSGEPVTPGRAAATLRVTAGAVTQLVDGLRGAGLVESAPNPGDRRSRVLELTDVAREHVSAYERGVVERLLPRFAVLSDAELRQLADLLGRIGVGA